MFITSRNPKKNDNLIILLYILFFYIIIYAVNITVAYMTLLQSVIFWNAL